MRKSYYILIATCAFALSACNFSVGTNKDFVTGLSHSYNGFAVDEVLLVGPDNVAMRSNEVALNTKVAIVAQGLTNFKLKDDKAFPGLMLLLTDKTGTHLLDEADLFANTDGYSATDASVLRGSLTVGDPMKSGETYHLKMRIWDKMQAESELTAEVDIVVK